MKISRGLNFQLHPRETSFSQIQKGIQHRFNVVSRSKWFSFMSSATHKSKSTYNFALFDCRNSTAYFKSQAEVKKINNFVFLVQTNSQVIRLDISVKITQLMHNF